MNYQAFKKKRLLVRIISSLLLTGFVFYIALQKNLQTWHWIAIVAVLALILVAGRGFCGFLCPVGSSLDLIHFICKKLHVKEIKRSEAFNRFIRIFRYFFCVFYFVLHFGLGIDPGWALVVLLIITTPIMVRKDMETCVSCSACSKVCPMQNDEVFTSNKTGDVSSVSCIYCGMCVGKCPKKHALSLKVAGRKIL